MTEPTSSVAGIVALVKFYGIKVLAGTIAAVIGFMVLWPKNSREGAFRLACSVIGSALFGDYVVNFAKRYFPWLLEGAPVFAPKLFEIPLYAVAGLPAWWVFGLVVRWFENRSNKDLGEVIDEVRRGRS